MEQRKPTPKKYYISTTKMEALENVNQRLNNKIEQMKGILES